MRANRLRGDLVRLAMHWLWGPLSPLGLGVAALTVLVDQANKLWMLYVYDIGAKAPVAIAPVFDLVLVWNQGISYGLLQQDSDFGRWALIAFAIVTSLALTVWLSQVTSKLVAASIGLIVGGAIGNAIDRIVHGAVADFFSFHAFGYQWYIFNIADVAIVAGVVGLLYESLFGGHKKVSKPPSM
jgi:signal peptidase II